MHGAMLFDLAGPYDMKNDDELPASNYIKNEYKSIETNNDKNILFEEEEGNSYQQNNEKSINNEDNESNSNNNVCHDDDMNEFNDPILKNLSTSPLALLVPQSPNDVLQLATETAVVLVAGKYIRSQ